MNNKTFFFLVKCKVHLHFPIQAGFINMEKKILKK